MAYDFLGLVNDVAQRVNEIELTSTNFSSAIGFYAQAKQSINSSIQFINQDVYSWPFNYVSQEDTLTAGTNRYSYQSNAKWVDFNTFRIKRNASFGNDTQYLRQMDYEEYLRKHSDDEYNTTDTSIRRLPEYVAQSPNQEYIVWPVPDEAYVLEYEYYTLPTDLSAFDDVPTLPADFRHVIVDGAMYYNYMFRGDYEAADRLYAKFQEGIKNMRKNYVNRYEYVRDTRVMRTNGLSNVLRTRS